MKPTDRLGPYEIVGAHRRRRHGGSVQGARHTSRPHCRHQGFQETELDTPHR